MLGAHHALGLKGPQRHHPLGHSSANSLSAAQNIKSSHDVVAPTKVKAILRVRPFLPNESGHGRDVFGIDDLRNQAKLVNPRNRNELLSYTFDGCYGRDSTQLRIFAQDVAPIVEKALSGFNATIFAYGNTGAGKTFTMEGTSSQPGMIPLTVQYVLESISKRNPNSFPAILPEIRISYLEIYKERVYDLLTNAAISNNANDLPIREDANRQIFIPDLTWQRVTSLADFERLWAKGVANRSTAATALNAHSSRSHSCLTIQIPQTTGNIKTKLHLIDLAGSEDNRRTANSGERLVESGAINKSLFVLGQVVESLNSGSSRVPYRDSKLTRLLQDSLGGRAYSLIIANVAPNESCLLDTQNTLNFASKSRLIENNVSLVEEEKPKVDIVERRKIDLEQWRKGKQSAMDDENTAPYNDISKRFKSSSPATISSVEAPIKKRSLANEESNPFSNDRSNSSLQAMILEKRIEEKVAEKLRQISKGTILSPLLKGEVGNLLAATREPRSPLTKAVKEMKDKLGAKTNSKTTTTAQKKKSNLSKRADDGLDPHAQQILHVVEPDLLTIFNHGTLKEIRNVREIGAKRATSILDFRQQHGLLTCLLDLVKGDVMTGKVLSKIILSNAIGKVDFVALPTAAHANHQEEYETPLEGCLSGGYDGNGSIESTPMPMPLTMPMPLIKTTATTQQSKYEEELLHPYSIPDTDDLAFINDDDDDDNEGGEESLSSSKDNAPAIIRQNPILPTSDIFDAEE